MWLMWPERFEFLRAILPLSSGPDQPSFRNLRLYLSVYLEDSLMKCTHVDAVLVNRIHRTKPDLGKNAFRDRKSSLRFHWLKHNIMWLSFRLFVPLVSYARHQ